MYHYLARKIKKEPLHHRLYLWKSIKRHKYFSKPVSVRDIIKQPLLICFSLMLVRFDFPTLVKI